MRTLVDCVIHVDGVGLESRARHGTSGFPLGCYRDDLMRAPVPAHWHNALEFSIVTQGQAEFLLGTRRIVLGEGEGVFINAGTLHAITAVSPDAFTDTVVFFPQLIAGDSESVFWHYVAPLIHSSNTFPATVLKKNIPWQKTCIEATGEALAAFCEENFGYEFRVREALSRSICNLLAQSNGYAAAQEDGPATMRSVAQRRSERLKTMISFIHKRYTSSLRVEDIAASASVSVSECLRCFREILGTTPMRYVREHRVHQATRLLSEGASATDAASACGFSDTSYFTKAFKATLGVTPSEYKRQGR